MKNISITLYIPEDLKAALENIAETENRSVSGQATHFLQQRVAEHANMASPQNAAASKSTKRKAA